MKMRAPILTGALVACTLPLGLAGQQAQGCSPEGNVQFLCGQQAPEDLVVVPGSEWVVAGAYSGTGGIMLINTRDRVSTRAYPAASVEERLDARVYDTCPGPPDAAAKAKFVTHGLYLSAGQNSVHRLYVVHHGSRESVEVFEVDARGARPSLTWIGCAVAPDPIGLNSVRGLADGGFIATNFLPRGGDPGLRQKLNEGEANGELWEWHTGRGWSVVSGSQASGANGLEISADGRWLYVAAWGSQSFFRLSRGETPPTREEVPLGFRVDNVRWASDGMLLAAGQGGVPPMQESIVVKINPETLAVQEIIRRPNTEAFAAGTVAVEVGNDYWVGSYRGDRIAIFPAGSR